MHIELGAQQSNPIERPYSLTGNRYAVEKALQELNAKYILHDQSTAISVNKNAGTAPPPTPSGFFDSDSVTEYAAWKRAQRRLRAWEDAQTHSVEQYSVIWACPSIPAENTGTLNNFIDLLKTELRVTSAKHAKNAKEGMVRLGRLNICQSQTESISHPFVQMLFNAVGSDTMQQPALKINEIKLNESVDIVAFPDIDTLLWVEGDTSRRNDREIFIPRHIFAANDSRQANFFDMVDEYPNILHFLPPNTEQNLLSAPQEKMLYP